MSLFNVGGSTLGSAPAAGLLDISALSPPASGSSGIFALAPAAGLGVSALAPVAEEGSSSKIALPHPLLHPILRLLLLKCTWSVPLQRLHRARDKVEGLSPSILRHLGLGCWRGRFKRVVETCLSCWTSVAKWFVAKTTRFATMAKRYMYACSCMKIHESTTCRSISPPKLC